MRRFSIIMASIIISGIFLYLTLRDVPLKEVINSLHNANLLWVVVSLMIFSVGLWTRAIRWRGLLDNKVSRQQAFYIIGITFLLNQLPFRAGEFARSILSTRFGVPVVTSATSIIVERLLDTFLVVICIFITLTTLPEADPKITRITTLFAGLSLIGLMILLLLVRYPQFARRILPCFAEQLLDHVLDGIQSLTHMRSFIHAVGWTIISWGLSFSGFYVLLWAFDVQSAKISMSVLSVTLAAFSIAIPVSIVALGPFEAAVRLAGEFVGLDSVVSTALGFVYHGVTIITYAIWGSLSLFMTGFFASRNLNDKQ